MKVVQTFSAPMHLVLRMDEEIAGHRMKSQWICDAIDKKLNKDTKCMILSNHSTIEILQAARYRCELDGRWVLAKYLQEFIEELDES